MKGNKILLLFLFFVFSNVALSQNKIADLRDSFTGYYYCYKASCNGDNYYEVSKHSDVDSLFIVDSLWSEGGPNPFKHKIYFNSSDSTWMSDSSYDGNFNKVDTLTIYTDPFYCGVFTIFYAEKIGPLGTIDCQGKEKEYYIFPIPTKEDLHFYFPKIPEQLRVELYDATGKLQLQKTFTQSLQLDVGTLPRGVYFVKIKGDKINVSKKIVLTD